jgi:predicted Rossmann fold nucleotide-binding protein DprA/Smf involved in DNA uptake
VAERCAGAGIQVISGGARGVDLAALSAAVEAGGGGLAVLPDRLDRAATSRDMKDAIRRGCLTLCSPFEPESSFHVGRAMGRNKHIYASADAALIVRFTTGEGGTWAGAVEQLASIRRDGECAPVFVRVAENPEDGVRQLRVLGAQDFPEEEFLRGNVAEVFKRMARKPSDLFEQPAASEVVASTPTREPIASPAEAPAPDTCYGRCLPLVLQLLREGRNEKELSEVAEKLDLLLPQLKKWLKRAIKEGRVIRKKKDGRFLYIDASSSEEQSLFHRDDDAA